MQEAVQFAGVVRTQHRVHRLRQEVFEHPSQLTNGQGFQLLRLLFGLLLYVGSAMAGLLV